MKSRTPIAKLKKLPSVIQKSVRVLRHFAKARALEIAALQAPPFFGVIFGGFSFEKENIISFLLLMFGSLALTAHIFVLNDWAGQASDLLAPKRATPSFADRNISSRQVAYFAVILIVIALAAFALIGTAAVLFGGAIALLGLFYSCSPIFGKSVPIAASLQHLFGGSLHFLLGYTLFHPADWKGFSLSLFFGLVFAAGHLNQEVRDYEGDLLNGIRTSAVVFGCRRTFFASLFLFSAAYILIIALSVLNILPKLLLLTGGGCLLHIRWSYKALECGLNFETAVWIQRRYRLLFAFIGLAMMFSQAKL